jgi:hypothetical protein
MPTPQPTWTPPTEPNETRSQLPDSAFAFPSLRREPLLDAAHVRNALSRFDQVKDASDEERALAFENILAAASYFGVHVSEKSWRDLMHG